MAISHADGGGSISQAALLDRVRRATRGLASLGVGPGDAVALILRNDIPHFEASLAAGSLGAYATPVNWHYKADEAGYVLRDCGARVLVVHADLLPDIAASIPPGVHVFVVPTPEGVLKAYRIPAAAGQVPPERTAWSDWLEGFAPWEEPPRQGPSSMIYTSGTTGRPKGVRRQPASPDLLAKAQVVLKTCLNVDADIRTVITGPLYHSAPNTFGLSAARAGGEIVLQPRFDAEELLRLIERHRINTLHMVPTMFVRLLKLPDDIKRKYDLSSLKFVVHAAAPCPPDVKRAMIEWWGPIIHEYYGGTETGIVVFCDSQEWLAHPGTVGRPLPGSTVKIFDDEGRELPSGEVGEIYLRAPHYADFTYQNAPAKREEIERDGLVSIGDVGFFDRDGFIFLCDRKRDMVIFGGTNIYPAEIEAVLIGMPGVHDCAVFGIPDAEMGESLAAVIEPRADATLDAEQVRGWLKERVANYKVPKLIEFRRDLPREDSGKIFKRKLREPYWEKAGRRI